jgi:hypothetical protein
MRIRYLLVALLAVAGGAQAQSISGNGGGISGNPPIPTPGSFALLSGATFTGPVNTTNAAGYQIQGSQVLNLLSNQTSPILSPETQNGPDAAAVYIPAPIVSGYNATAGLSTYANMYTTNLTVTGTVTNHYGMRESTVNVINGGAGYLNAELNEEKSFIVYPSGFQSLTGENKEINIENYGTLDQQYGLLVNPFNESTGTISYYTGVYLIPWNFNTTAGAWQQYVGISCQPQSGSGAALSADFCLFNQDKNGVIGTVGHLSFRPDQGQPTLSGCGTSPSLDSRGSDMAGNITEGSSATGCTLTFNVPFKLSAPHCMISSPNGAPFTGYTTSQTQLAITNASASGNIYSYICTGVF